MKFILMNKDVEVMIVDYNTVLKGFDEIIEIKKITYAPVNILNKYINNDNTLKELNRWFRGRGIPKYRDNIDLLLLKLGVSLPEELIDKSFALSLSDQYWIKPYDSTVSHKDINFFENDFEYLNFLNVVFSDSFNKHENISLKSPNNTTDGMLKKSWIIENNVRYLLKGGYKFDIIQPFNEVLSTMICEALGFYHVPYTIDLYKDKIVSKCPCFINENTEYISAF